MSASERAGAPRKSPSVLLDDVASDVGGMRAKKLGPDDDGAGGGTAAYEDEEGSGANAASGGPAVGRGCQSAYSGETDVLATLEPELAVVVVVSVVERCLGRVEAGDDDDAMCPSASFLAFLSWRARDGLGVMRSRVDLSSRVKSGCDHALKPSVVSTSTRATSSAAERRRKP